MKIKTLSMTIKHQQNPAYDAERLSALEEVMAEFCPPEDVAESMIDTLQKFNPDVREIVICDRIVMLEIGVTIREVSIAEPSYADLFTSLLAEVLK